MPTPSRLLGMAVPGAVSLMLGLAGCASPPPKVAARSAPVATPAGPVPTQRIQAVSDVLGQHLDTMLAAQMARAR